MICQKLCPGAWDSSVNKTEKNNQNQTVCLETVNK